MWTTMLLQYGICTEQWQFRSCRSKYRLGVFPGRDGAVATPAQVPGTVHQDLINHKQLPDPFYGINEQKIQWVENEDWEYRTAFTVTPEQLKRETPNWFLKVLTHTADVYLNGALLLKADNMFVGYTIPVKSQLRIGETFFTSIFIPPSGRHCLNITRTDSTIRQTTTITTNI